MTRPLVIPNPVRIFDHLDLRVKSLSEAVPFYSVLLPAVGFPARTNDPQWVSFAAARDHPTPEFIALIEDPSHVPNSTRVAFWCDSKEGVDQIAGLLHGCGAKNIEGPEFCPEYTPTYYAVFFEDPCGNRLEVCCRTCGPEQT